MATRRIGPTETRLLLEALLDHLGITTCGAPNPSDQCLVTIDEGSPYCCIVDEETAVCVYCLPAYIDGKWDSDAGEAVKQFLGTHWYRPGPIQELFEQRPELDAELERYKPDDEDE
jgi:hypothetical protein